MSEKVRVERKCHPPLWAQARHGPRKQRACGPGDLPVTLHRLLAFSDQFPCLDTEVTTLNLED